MKTLKKKTWGTIPLSSMIILLQHLFHCVGAILSTQFKR